ncbi:MAG: hypothetical protein NTV70_12900 [Acidobacteria bacterium]|nr:hypothetical protein [Acidobacteriota bacterium]
MRWVLHLVVLLLALTGLCLPATGQSGVASVRIQSSPAGAPFLVDGVRYVDAVTLPWVIGSRHTLDAVGVSAPLQLPVEYGFINWTESTGLWTSPSPTAVVTASPVVTQYTVSYAASYRVEIEIPDRSIAILSSNSQELTQAVQYIAEGTDLLLQANPGPGWLFVSWGPEYPPFGPNPQPSQVRVKVVAPIVLRPWFGRARVVSFDTVPAGLNIYIDRTLSPTPTTRDWAFGGRYPLSAPDAQQDQAGQWWIFDSWSSGGPQTQTYTVTEAGNFALTGRFKPGYRAIFETSPHGLRLNIDGRENWPSYQFTWALDSVKTIAAPREQADASGRRWRFARWEHGGEAAQAITVKGDLRWKAVYELQPRLTLESVPSGLTMEVDGQPCRTPCQLDRDRGATLRVTPPPVIPLTADSRLELTGGGEQTVALTTDQRVRFTYARTHRLSTAVIPAEAGMIETLPVSTTGFLPENAVVTVRAAAEPGYRHVRWEGDYPVLMSGPRAVRAIFERTPWSAGARNAAGTDVAAPGGQIEIIGLNLAQGEEVAVSQSPVPQMLAGVVVLWQDRMLPLISVTPERIVAVLPWDVPEGSHTLVVRQARQPDATARFTVETIAPGLFSNATYLESGDVLLAATGLGPYDRPLMEGFAPSAEMRLAGLLEVLVDGTHMLPLSAIASRTSVGLTEIRLPASVPGDATIQLSIGGRLSNIVRLGRP